jgi:hypothetical protein
MIFHVIQPCRQANNKIMYFKIQEEQNHFCLNMYTPFKGTKKRDKKDIHNIQIYGHSLSWLGTDTSIKRHLHTIFLFTVMCF